MMADGLFAALVNVAILAYIARNLGPEAYGMYAFVFAVAALLGMLGHMGLDGVLTRELVKEPPSRQPRILGTAFLLRAGGYLLAAAAVLVVPRVGGIYSWEEELLFAAAAMFLLVQPLSAVLTVWFRAQADLGGPSFANMIATVVGGGLKVAALAFGFGIVAVGLSQAVAVIFGAVVLASLFHRRGGPSPSLWSASRAEAGVMLREGWRLHLGSILASIYVMIDIPMLRLLTDIETVGQYAAPARLVAMTHIFAAAVATTLYPSLVRAHALDRGAFESLMRTGFSAVVLGAYVIIAANLLFGNAVLNLLLGENFEESGTIASILVLSLPFAFARQIISRWVILDKKGNYLIWSEALGAATVVGLNLLLIPRFGGSGAAISMVAAYITTSILSQSVNKDSRRILRIQILSFVDPLTPFLRLLSNRGN